MPSKRPIVASGDLSQAWAEIRRLRSDLDRLRSQRLVPKFGGVVLDSVAEGSAHYPLGFEPYYISFLMNFGAASTVASGGLGSAVRDLDVDGEIYQACTAFRVSAAGQFRGSSQSAACGFLANDAAGLDITLVVDSFDLSGFSYTLDTGGGTTPTVLRGFAIGQ